MLNEDDKLVCDRCGELVGDDGDGGYFVDTPDKEQTEFEFCSWECVAAYASESVK